MLRQWFARLRGLVLFLAVSALLVAGVSNALNLLRTALESYQPLQLEVAPAQSLVTFEGSDARPNRPSGTAARPGETASLTGRVVLVVINGLSLEDVETLPALQNDTFRSISTGAYLFSGPVQQTPPALVTLLTGAGVELTGGLTLDHVRPSSAAPVNVQQLGLYDHLFAAVKRSRFTTALFGTNNWYYALPQDSLDYYTTFDPRQPAADVTDNALNFLKKKSANFTIIQLSALGQASQDYGPTSAQANQARQNLNTALTRLTGDEIELRRTTLIITGDRDDAVKAGERWTAPLVMAGQAVQPGEKIWGRQEDVASTIATLLGVEIPRHNQGRLLNSLLSMPPADLGEKYLAIVEQRLALQTAFRARLNLALPLAINDPLAIEAEKNVRVARQNFRLGSYQGIEQVVDDVLRYTRSDMEEARQEWFAQGRGQRALLGSLVLTLPLLLLLIWRSALSLLAAGAAIIATALLYGLYGLEGRSFTFNAIGLPALQLDSIWRAGLSLLAGLTIPFFFFDWAERRRVFRRGRVDLGFQQIADLRNPVFPFERLLGCCILLLAWLAYFSVAGWLVWYYWRFGYFGPLMGTPPVLPDLGATFMLYFAFTNLLGLSLMIVPAALILTVLYWLKWRARRDRLEKTQYHNILAQPQTD